MGQRVLDIRMDGFRLVCYRTKSKTNPFRVYRLYCGHRRQIAKYGDFMSVIYFIRDLYTTGADTFSMPELVAWAKEVGAIY